MVNKALAIASSLSSIVLLLPSITPLAFAQTVVATVPVGSVPRNVGVNDKTNRAYVANEGSGTVSVIDGSTNTVVATVPVVASLPFGVGVNDKTNRAYVANFGSGTVSVIDGSTNTVVATVLVGSGPVGVGVNDKTNRAYVANEVSESLSQY